MLQIASYQKAYGSTTVLSIPKLQLQNGIYWLKGENGAGKTTFLKSLAGIIPFNGDVTLNGINLRNQRKLYTAAVSFAEAEPGFPSFLTGDDLIHFFSETKGRNELLESTIINGLGMSSYLKNNISTYSSGMLKKLSLLLAFSGNPKLILLDEPFVTLDVDAVSVMERLITDSFKQGISFLISSHQQLEFAVPFSTLTIQQKTIQQNQYDVVSK